MQNSCSARISEIQRLRVLADLLELIGSIEEDNLFSKEEISNNIRNIIMDNFLFEPTNIYSKGLLEQFAVENDKQVGNVHLNSITNGNANLHKISEFYDITLLMVLDDKGNFIPLIFTMYNEHSATFDIENVCLAEGSFPPKGTEFVIEWISLHQNELLNMCNAGVIVQISPLD